MQSTGHSSMHDLSFTSMHGSVITYVMNSVNPLVGFERSPDSVPGPPPRRPAGARRKLLLVVAASYRLRGRVCARTLIRGRISSLHSPFRGLQPPIRHA